MNYVIRRPNADQHFFHYYEAFIAPKHGLCSIKASIEGPDGNPHQTYSRNDFNQLEAMLEKQYGRPTMATGSVNPNTIWSNYDNEQRLMGGIRSIGATLMDDGTVSVIYHFRNLNECIKEIKSSDL
jgi:hypothetical protein